MPGSVTKSASPKGGDSPKPVNIFYIWYVELCRRVNMQPLSNVKPAKPKNETVLDFVADRIKPEEWAPIINALRLDTSLHVIAIRSRAQCKFLHDVDTEEKTKHMKRRAGSLFTAYVLKSLLRSLSSCIRRNQVISCLELDGVPVIVEYIDILIDALKKNTSIKMLTIKHCSMRDLGCQLLCNALRTIANVEVLNLSSCGLGSLSAQYIAQVVKYQQINRYCESWHNSLRYEDPEVGIMAGLKRITLNNNPGIGDDGLIYILDELDNDLWIRALDMQRCGITENVAVRLLDMIDYSRSLEIADFRNNDQLSVKTVENILESLKNKQRFGYENEYQWCLTTTTLQPEGSVYDAYSTISTKPSLKSKSAPIKLTKVASNISSGNQRCNTAFYRRGDRFKCVQNKGMNETKTDVTALNEELQKEVAKRISSETENRRLKQELQKIKSVVALNETPVQPKEKVVKFDPMPRPKKVKPAAKHEKKPARVEFVFENRLQAHDILQNLVKHTHHDADSDDELTHYFQDILDETKSGENIKEVEDGSNASLIKFMKDLKNEKAENNARSMIWNNTKAGGCLQKLCAR